MRCWLLALSLLVAASATADEVTSFSPHDVTMGTELTLLGDFHELAAAGRKPQLFGSRMDGPRGVVFVVRSVSDTEIHAVAKRFPGRKGGSLVGQRWSLVVLPRAGAPLLAPDTFLTVGPELIDVGAASAAPGETLELLVDNVGTGKLLVHFGEKPVKPLRAAGAPVTLPPGVPGTPLSVIVPKLPSGPHPISLENAIGPSPTEVDFDVAP
jgi:hypothetical protein